VLRTTACVGGRLAFAYLDAKGVVSDEASDTSNDVASDVIVSSNSGDVLVGSRELGVPTPFAQVVAEFCFLLMLAELEAMRNESLAELTARLICTVMTLTPSEESVGARIKSGARSLLDRLSGKTVPSRLNVYITVQTPDKWKQVSVTDLLTKCGLRTPTGMKFIGDRCDTVTFGWCVAPETIAGLRGLHFDNAGQNLTRSDPNLIAMVNQVVLAAEFKSGASLSAVARSHAPAAALSRSDPSMQVTASTSFRGRNYGACTECRCTGYLAPPAERGVSCDACGCAPLKHIGL